jgi:hypothetical protein
MVMRLIMGVVLVCPVLFGAGCGRSAPPAPPTPVAESPAVAEISAAVTQEAPVEAAAGETTSVLLHVPDMTEKLKLV